jgi:hypothetical protein
LWFELNLVAFSQRIVDVDRQQKCDAKVKLVSRVKGVKSGGKTKRNETKGAENSREASREEQPLHHPKHPVSSKRYTLCPVGNLVLASGKRYLLYCFTSYTYSYPRNNNITTLNLRVW